MWRIWTAIAVSLIGFFQFGVALVIINTMLETLSQNLDFDEDVGGAVITAVLFLGAALGGLVTGPFEKSFGKYSQLILGLFFITGNVLCAATTDDKICSHKVVKGCVPVMIFVGRFIVGFSSGLVFVISPKFLAKVSPPDIRGSLGASSQLSAASGVLVSMLTGFPFEIDDFDIGIEWWRVMFMFATALGILHVLMMFLVLPLFGAKGEEMRMNFQGTLRERISIEHSFEIIDTSSEDGDTFDQIPRNDVTIKTTNPATQYNPEAPPSIEASNAPQEPALYLLFEKRYRRSVILGIGVPIACQLIAVNMLASYSTKIFEDAGLDRAIIGSIMLGVSAVLGSIIAIYFFDRVGRKTMAYFSFSGMTICHIAIALFDLAKEDVSGPFSLVAVLTFIFMQASGCGPLTFAYAPEVVPSEIAHFVLGAGQALSILWTLILVLVYPSVQKAIGTTFAFLILAAISFACLIFLKLFMVETKGKSLEDIISELTTTDREIVTSYVL